MGVKWGCSGGFSGTTGPLAESMAIGLVPSTLLTVPTMLPFPLATPNSILPTTTALQLCDFARQHVDFLCSARLEGLPGVFHDPWALRGTSVLYADGPTPGMGGALSPREGAEGTLSGLLPLRSSGLRMKWPDFLGRGL